MRSVFVAFDPPIPITGGGSRTYYMLKALTEVSDCELFICFPTSVENLSIDIQKNCKAIYVSHYSFNAKPKTRLSAWFFQFRMIFLSFTLASEEVIKTADYYLLNPCKSSNLFKRWYYKKIRSLIYNVANKRYASGFKVPARTLERLPQFNELKTRLLESLSSADLLWIDFSYPLSFFNDLRIKFPDLKIICNAHNIEYIFYQKLSEIAEDKILKEWFLLQSRLLKNIEIQGFLQCNNVIVCSNSDKNILQEETFKLNITVVPNGVDTNYFKPFSADPVSHTLLFTGTMTYLPNKDAVHYFIKNIFPLLKIVLPSCNFLVAGAQSSTSFPEYKDRSDIEFVESPPDMRPQYNRANLVVVPLRSGSGTRLKILEAMSMGKPVVSTLVGAEGIEAEHGTHLFLANTEKEFANHILYLLSNNNVKIDVTKASIRLVRNKYDWRVILNDLKSLIETI
jgi:glycosyltransferase involved in cell wall biosynthesis